MPLFVSDRKFELLHRVDAHRAAPVENEHRGKGYSNVMYIAATRGCTKNTAYLARQAPAFLAGRTPPDFAPDDFEVDFKGRATEADLTPLGRSQLGLSPQPATTAAHSLTSEPA